MEILDPYHAQVPQSKLKYAGFGLRVAALFLDLIVSLVGLFLLMFLISIAVIVFSGRPAQQEERNIVIIASYVLFPCACILYFAIMESSKKRGTLGKIGVGIKVGGDAGEKISFSTALKRSLGKIVSAAIVGIGFLMPIFNSKRQALHDKLTRTFVYER